MERGNEWTMRRAKEVGERVAYFRQRTMDVGGRPLTVQGLADRCAREGLELSRPTLSKLEKGIRQSVTVDEVTVIARALGVSPIMLLFPLGQAETVEVLPGHPVRSFDAMQWFAGEVELADGPGGQLVVTRVMDGDYGLFRSHQQLVEHLTRLNDALGAGTQGPPYTFMLRPGETAPSPDEAPMREIRDLAGALLHIRNSIREHGLTPPALPAPLAGLDPQPIVAAIVVSPRGVLITRRQDGRPPVGFVTGEIEPGELAEDAAVREVKEETSLEVRVGEEIGRRVHPVTGRRMIYLAASPVRGTDVAVGDEAELTAVWWASPSEAFELMPDMFGPVRDYLAGQAI